MAREKAAANAREEAATKAGANVTASPTAGEAVGQEMPDTQGRVADQGATTDEPPATDSVDAAGGGEAAGLDVAAATASGGPQQSEAEVAPERFAEPRPAVGATSAGSMAQLQLEWATSGEVSSARAASDPAAGIMPSTLHSMITDYHGHLVDFSKGALAKLLQVEQSIQVDFSKGALVKLLQGPSRFLPLSHLFLHL